MKKMFLHKIERRKKDHSFINALSKHLCFHVTWKEKGFELNEVSRCWNVEEMKMGLKMGSQKKTWMTIRFQKCFSPLNDREEVRNHSFKITLLKSPTVFLKHKKDLKIWREDGVTENVCKGIQRQY